MKIVKAGKNYLVNGALVDKKAFEAIFGEVLTEADYARIIELVNQNGESTAEFTYKDAPTADEAATALEELYSLAELVAFTVSQLSRALAKFGKPSLLQSLNQIANKG